MPNGYDLTAQVKVTAKFTDEVTLAAADPTTVTLVVTKPDDTTTTYTYGVSVIQRASAGSYYALISPDQAGRWRYRWHGAGSFVGTGADQFLVRPN